MHFLMFHCYGHNRKCNILIKTLQLNDWFIQYLIFLSINFDSFIPLTNRNDILIQFWINNEFDDHKLESSASVRFLWPVIITRPEFVMSYSRCVCVFWPAVCFRSLYTVRMGCFNSDSTNSIIVLDKILIASDIGFISAVR